MGTHNSSLTRVVPVFDQLIKQDPTGLSWLPKLLKISICGHPDCKSSVNFSDIQLYKWGKEEAKLSPPLALLSWLVRNLPETEAKRPNDDTDTNIFRRKLFDQDADTAEKALSKLNFGDMSKAWYILEGTSQPDAYIETDEAIVVVEGKRTELEPKVGTTWMPKRHQILRHLDAAWEIRGHKSVYGIFIVEGDGDKDAFDVPPRWVAAALNSFSMDAVCQSLPHRGPQEQQNIALCFRGIITWQSICNTFGLNWSSLPNEV